MGDIFLMSSRAADFICRMCAAISELPALMDFLKQ